MKNSFTILELIVTLIISSVVIIFSTIFLKNSYLENSESLKLEEAKIKMLSTKIFLEKNIDDISELYFNNKKLYFKNSILLDNIEEFNIQKTQNFVDIFINYDEKIIQSWQIKRD